MKTFAGTSGTSKLSVHLKVDHQITQDGKTRDPFQTILTSSGQAVDPFQLDEDRMLKCMTALVDFVVDNKQPFQLVESK